MSERFQVRDGSQSGHCCFDATVVDTSVPRIIGGKHYVRDGEPQWESVAECFSRDEAEMVADALNLAVDLAGQVPTKEEA